MTQIKHKPLCQLRLLPFAVFLLMPASKKTSQLHCSYIVDDLHNLLFALIWNDNHQITFQPPNNRLSQEQSSNSARRPIDVTFIANTRKIILSLLETISDQRTRILPPGQPLHQPPRINRFMTCSNAHDECWSFPCRRNLRTELTGYMYAGRHGTLGHWYTKYRPMFIFLFRWCQVV